MVIRKKSIFAWLGLAIVFLAILILFKTTTRAEESPAVASLSVVPIQLGRESYGVAMVDPKSETIWIYEINNRGAARSRLKLFAARNWHYDKMLEEFNSAEPRPQQVRDMIEQMLRPGSTVRSANDVNIMSLAEPNTKIDNK
jgi:hypothetical protein